MKNLCIVVFTISMTPAAAAAQEDRRAFVGALIGVSTLSADGRSVTSPPDAMLSLYKPENGPAVNAFAGWHVTRFLSLQANYMWNRNDIALVSSFVTPRGGGFYEQQRHSAHHAGVADLLLYFRRRGSAIRPYLGTGLALVRFSSADVVRTVSSDFAAPAGAIRHTTVALRSHVGIDVRLSSRLLLRYSFSETIGGNPVSPHLTPPGRRGLANFQNLFGVAAQF
ncbi:MAG: outer membrane beta-barrel protein [Burkholderiales bacterium]